MAEQNDGDYKKQIEAKRLANIQKLQPNGTTKPPAPDKDHKGKRFALKHGAYSFLTSGIIPCKRCLIKDECEKFKEDKTCEVIETFQVEKVKEIMELPYIKPQDVTLAQMLARELSFQAIVAKYIGKVGLFRPDWVQKKKSLALQPVLHSYWTSVNTSIRMCEQLGLSPMARAKLKVGDAGFDFAKAMAQIEDGKNAK